MKSPREDYLEDLTQQLQRAIRLTDPKPIFFWTEEKPPTVFVDLAVPIRARKLVAQIMADAPELNAYRGSAGCRICGKRLGSRDLFHGGFVFPEGAEHYVLEHDIWMPELDEMLEESS